MPCMCHYTPPEASKRMIKGMCQQIVDEVKHLNKIGDPLGCSIADIHKLIDHLYRGECDEKPSTGEK